MDRTVPLAAARMLDFVRATEVGTDGPSGYNVIYGHNQDKLPKPVTRMTVDEILGAMASWSKRFGSSATAGYQFMRSTLTDLKRELRLRGTQIFDEDLQDRLGYHLLKRRGYEDFMAGRISRTEFGKRLSQEWASFPVLASVKGAHRVVERGQSYYAGDGLNKALVTPEEFEAVIDDMKELGDALPALPATPAPRPENEEPIILPETAPVPTTKPLTPVEQMNKPVAGAKAGLATGGISGAILLILSRLGWLPDGLDDPEVMLAIGIIGGWLPGQIGSFVAAYKARDLRFMPKRAEPS
ncbi:hypothetical protein JYU29_05585 [Tianweitania sp. BSSL-BM11]|uniref:Glycoside hydrolase family 104 protein n=1 Tax=Tianweitania aestuarii TaxID=2814886 RepID=A0ABS5RT67_9HYPH|nr:hypothetical protein [Tianweitania aestuarii]MBS9720157.1 hypothetical protein [Tianweitania aestuarii]